MPASTAVTDYIDCAPPAARKALRQIRTAIRKAAPGITERISYRIPTFDIDGRYILFMAGFKSHVSVYPRTPSMMARYGRQLAKYRAGAGTLRFALDQRLPLALITKIAKLRVAERRGATKKKGAKKKERRSAPGRNAPERLRRGELALRSYGQALSFPVLHESTTRRFTSLSARPRG